MSRIIYSKYSDERDVKFNIVTTIEEQDGKKIVYKKALQPEGLGHVQNMPVVCKELNELYRDTSLQMADCKSVYQDCVSFEYIKGRGLDNLLDEYLEQGNKIKVEETLLDYVEEVRIANSKEIFHKSQEFVDVFGDAPIIEGVPATSIANIDMIVDNVLLTDEGKKVIDYEWTFHFQVPTQYIIYRLIHYFVCKSVKRLEMFRDELFDRVGISESQQIVYEEMERNFQDYVRGTTVPVRDAVNWFGQECYSTEELLYAKRHWDYEVGKNQIEVFVDRGNGDELYLDYEVSPVEDSDRVELLIHLKEEVSHVRIDPAMDRCLVYIEDVKPELKIHSNCVREEANLFAFDTEDPQIIFYPKAGNKELYVVLTINTASEEVVNWYDEVAHKKDVIIAKRDAVVETRVKMAEVSAQRMMNRDTQLDIYRGQIAAMEGTFGWRAYRFYRRVKAKLFHGQRILPVESNPQYLSLLEQDAALANQEIELVNQIDTTRITYNLEQPVNGTSDNYGMINIEGWCFTLEVAITLVEVHVGDQIYQAQMGLERSDVGDCFAHMGDNSRYSGFQYSYKVPEELYGQEIEIEVCIISENNSVSESRTVKMHSEEEIKLLRNDILAHHDEYEIWCKKHEMTEGKRNYIREHIKSFDKQPLISIVMPTYNPQEDIFREALDSVLAQLYTNWELCIVDDCSSKVDVANIVAEYQKQYENIHFKRLEQNSNISVATNAGVEMISGEYIFLMDHDDLVAEEALYEVVRELQIRDDIDVIYSDDDKISMEGKRFAPQFKPDFSPELLLSFMYFSHIFVIRKELYKEVGGCRVGYEGSQDYDLALRVTEKARQVVHIPKVLYHWRATPQSTASSAKAKPESLERGRQAVQDTVDRRELPLEAYMPEFAKKASVGVFALRFAGENPPKVSIVIPTKNHVDILKRCVDSIFEKTTYRNYEVILVDNYSDDPDTITYEQSVDCKIIQVANVNGQFNFSRMVNAGVEVAEGEYVVLLNNDTEIIEPDWIQKLLAYMIIDRVGVVGTKLLYSDRTVQHAGVLLGVMNGIASHAFKLIPDWDGGYLSFAKVARNYSAVTAAAFMTSKKVYEEVNGFDEEDFAVSYNDVDYCMRVKQAGYRVVYNAESLLFHHEGKSRGVEQTGYYSDGREEYNFVSRWITNNDCDSYYNPNQSKETERFELNLKRVFSLEKRESKILLITHNLNFEGAPIVQLNVAKQLQGHGYTFEVLAMKEGPLRAEYENAGIAVKVVTIDGQHYDNVTEQLKLLQAEYENQSFDACYANTLDCYWGIHLGHELKIPTIWGIHESATMSKFFENRDERILEAAKEAAEMATKVVYVAEATEKMFESYDTFNTTVIANGIDFTKVEAFQRDYDRQEVRKELGIKEDEVLISIFGTFCLRKGHKVFVEAAKKIKAQILNARFLMVGMHDSTYGSSVVDMIEQSEIREDIQVLDACSDVYKYYMATDIYVCTSYEESSPLVILESMAFGNAIVSTNVFGIPEQVRNNQEALLVEPDAPDQVAASVIQLVQDEKLRNRLARNAYYRVRTHFKYQSMICKYDEIFQEVVEEGMNRVYEMYRNERNERDGE